MDRIDPRLRRPRLMLALRPLATPAIWWAILLLASRFGGTLGYRSYLLNVAASLLLAWIVIRATSVLVRDPFLSHAIAVFVWLVAALDILGLLDSAATALDSVALTVGTLRLSLLAVLKAGLMLAVLLWVAFAVSRLVQVRVSRIPSFTPSLQVLIANLLRIALVVLAVVVALNTVGIDLTALAVFSGAVGVGIGLGLQKIVANLLSGIILLLEKSIKPGDVIQIEKTFGWITSLGARYVSVRSRDGKEYLIPNEDLITHPLVNWTHSTSLVRLDVPFGVAYGSDLCRVRDLAVAAAQHAGRVLGDPRPVCHATSLGDAAINFVLRFWIADPQNGVTNVRGDVIVALYESLCANGIEIPFPRYEVRIKGDRDAGEASMSAPLSRAAKGARPKRA